MTIPLKKSPGFIEWAVRKALPLRTAEEADREIVRLTIEVMKLQAALDARGMKI
jgi:hypothetical protein